jgi:hypothetical protein
MKAINWTASAAIVRGLVILFVSTFFGALALPLGAGGTLPSTWAAWRPELSVALSAAIVAEIVWIRSHLAQYAQALGIPTTSTTNPATKAAGAAVMLLALGGLVRGTTACSQSPLQTAADVGDVAQLTGCVLSTYATDKQGGMSEDATVLDVAAKCKLDAYAVQGVLDAHKRAEVIDAQLKCASLVDSGSGGSSR